MGNLTFDGRRRTSVIETDALFETHLPVSNLTDSIEFYTNAVGLRLAHVLPVRQAAFFWIGPGTNGMLGLWATGPAPVHLTSQIAFRVRLRDVFAAPRALRASGIAPVDFNGRPTDLPVVLAWMPAAAVYFRDPDGHLLQYVAMLPGKACDDCGVLPWRMWELMTRESTSVREEAISQNTATG
jgi:lactoylglutathione lyase